uniref:Uncharacterized protein n=1 Tax=Anguilla anguilla TaxID=7936 RepID=A0A0E9X1S2_ANGAN
MLHLCFHYAQMWATWWCTVTSQQGFESWPGPFCVEFACSPCVCGVSSRYSSFLPQLKDMQIRLMTSPACIPASRPVHAGTGSSAPTTLTRNKQVLIMDGYSDVHMIHAGFCFDT